MKSLVIIPSRLNSTRLPEKPLILIKGKSLLSRVYHQVKKCKNKTDILIATDNEKIVDHVKSFNGEVVLTNEKHISGTDRCNEAVQSLNKKYDLIINVQGDEPIINPIIIDEIINTFDDINDEIITVAKDPNVPGINFTLPRPNIVTNKKLNVLIIFANRDDYFTSNCFFLSN